MVNKRNTTYMIYGLVACVIMYGLYTVNKSGAGAGGGGATDCRFALLRVVTQASQNGEAVVFSTAEGSGHVEP